MKYFKTNNAMFSITFILFFLFSCVKEEATPIDKTDDIVEIAIRQVKTGQMDAFTAARSKFINVLTKEEGVSNDREYKSFFHFNPNQDQSLEVYVGMTQYEDLATFQAVGQKLGSSAEAGAFFSTFDVLTFTAMKPIKEGTEIDLSKIATGEQVLEIAIRDLSKYPNFDKADYEAKRDAFLAELAKQSARVDEYQWQSVLDPNLVIGMTVYTNQQAFFELANNPTFASNPAVGAFLGKYPPTNYGELCTVVK